MHLRRIADAFFCIFISVLAELGVSTPSSSWTPVCGYPGRPAHGFAVPAQTGFAEGELVRFFCEPFRYLLGSSLRKCTADGTWKGSLPLCVKSTPARNYTWNVNKSLHTDTISDNHDDTCAKSIDVFPIHIARRMLDVLAINIKFKIPVESQLQLHDFNITTSNPSKGNECKNNTFGKEKKPLELRHEIDTSSPLTHVWLTSSSGSILCQIEVCEIVVITEQYSSKSCGEPDAPLNAVVRRPRRHSATYKCLHGEPLSGNVKRVCIRNTWTGTIPSCPTSYQSDRYSVVFLSVSFTFNLILTCLVVGLFVQVYRFMQMRKHHHLCSVSSNATTHVLLNDTYNPMGSVFITEDNYDVPSEDIMVASRRTSRLPSASTGGRPSLSSSGHHNSTPSNGNVFPEDDYSCCSVNNIDASSGDGALHIYAEIPEGILPIIPRQRMPPPTSEPPVDISTVYSEPVDDIDPRGESRTGIYTEPYGTHAAVANSGPCGRS